MKYWFLLVTLPLVALGQEYKSSPKCHILSMKGTPGLYLKPEALGILTIPKGTTVVLREPTGETKVCRLDHHVYPFIEGSGTAFDLHNSQHVFKEDGSRFGLPLLD